MARKPETRRQRRIRDAIADEFPASSWNFKTHGNEFQGAGLPDIIGHVGGIFFGFEVKEPRSPPTDLQLETIGDIQRAGGIALVIEEPWQAIQVIREARRLSTERSIVFGSQRWVRVVLRAAHREDLDSRRAPRIRRRQGRTVRSPIK